ncbi:MAG TPA: alkaline phosphatase family protein [Kofleriaceae bacterium]|nr:alkaline phosphatase family protein [Kofleriaceae bacterium]
MGPLHRHPDTGPIRQVVAAALTLLVLGAVGAVQAGLTGASFMFDLEQVEPALSHVPPALEDPHTPRLARRVFLVMIDGLRLDRSYELPFLDELRRRGVDSEASSHYPSWSRPNYVSILTGVPPYASGVRTNHHSTPVALDSLMDRARAAGLRVATATDYDVLPRMFLRRRTAEPPTAAAPSAPPGSPEARDAPRPPGTPETLDLDTEATLDLDSLEAPFAQPGVRDPDANLASPFDDARYAPWPGGFSEAGSALAAGDADLVVLLVGAVDSAGHAHGGDSPEYRAAAETADRALARVLAHIDLAQDAVVITADHGHTGRGGHGGVEPEVLAVPLIAAGAGIRPGATAVDARLIDIAPTVAALLALPAPGHGLGRTLTEILTLDDQARARRIAADQVRLGATRATVRAAETAAASDVLAQRAQRIALVAGGALLAGGFAALLIRRRVLRLDRRALVVSIPAFFVVYYGLLATMGRFSPSLLPAQGHLAGQMVRYGVLSMIVQLAATLWALGNRPTLGERLAAANGIAWTGLMSTMVPAGLIWAFFPPPYVDLPGPLWLVLIPAALVAVACAAINVALTLAVEVIIFAARAWHRVPSPE